jgi:phosphoglycerate dehydrogenase-like enzyme
MVRALADRRLRAAGLDVLPQEPLIREEAAIFHQEAVRDAEDFKALVANDVLLRFPNVIVYAAQRLQHRCGTGADHRDDACEHRGIRAGEATERCIRALTFALEAIHLSSFRDLHCLQLPRPAAQPVLV